MKIKGIHYGLTLLYSYLLPVIDIEEVGNGFKFKFIYGEAHGIECAFKENVIETYCSLPSGLNLAVVRNILGFSKHHLFKNLCSDLHISNCVSNKISLIYEQGYKKPVAHAIYLSRDTNFFLNTVKWCREALFKGYIESSSFIPLEFKKVKHMIDVALNARSPYEEVIGLIKVRGFGIKSAKAFLLHTYGLTHEAPLDRHYVKFLGVSAPNMKKEACIGVKLSCLNLPFNCPYSYAVKRYRTYNGLVQSIVYIYDTLRSQGANLVKILVKDPSKYLDDLERLLDRLREMPMPTI
ncbi:MAG: hypothetical protein QXW94_04855 [Desulfurococcaceae archaeon]